MVIIGIIAIVIALAALVLAIAQVYRMGAFISELQPLEKASEDVALKLRELASRTAALEDKEESDKTLPEVISYDEGTVSIAGNLKVTGNVSGGGIKENK